MGLKSEFTRKFGHDKFDLSLEDFVGHVQQVVEYHSRLWGYRRAGSIDLGAINT